MNETPAEDSEFFNVTEQQRQAGDFYLHHESWPAFELFQTCATQWRLSPGGERVALDYTAVIAVAQFLGLGSDILQEVRYLELGAITAHRGGNLEDTLYGS